MQAVVLHEGEKGGGDADQEISCFAGGLCCEALAVRAVNELGVVCVHVHVHVRPFMDRVVEGGAREMGVGVRSSVAARLASMAGIRA